ncbi:hypothetical protein LR48_Vigan205s004700 [Vigna angularis]|uniref:Uncharacterized protein n=1 Tax=Phaseolus angularis TaxID=3914 RepID=A0A0L9T5N2_PHAAN|nr:hypothetical protein LR48_Vigan205s004700 [Vigna angularis]
MSIVHLFLSEESSSRGGGDSAGRGGRPSSPTSVSSSYLETTERESSLEPQSPLIYGERAINGIAIDLHVEGGGVDIDDDGGDCCWWLSNHWWLWMGCSQGRPSYIMFYPKQGYGMFDLQQRLDEARWECKEALEKARLTQIKGDRAVEEYKKLKGRMDEQAEKEHELLT